MITRNTQLQITILIVRDHFISGRCPIEPATSAVRELLDSLLVVSVLTKFLPMSAFFEEPFLQFPGFLLGLLHGCCTKPFARLKTGGFHIFPAILQRHYFRVGDAGLEPATSAV